MTTLNFKTYYAQNLFFLVDSFSCWSIHNRQYLKEKLPDFYDVVKSYLSAYAKLRQKKYGWGTVEKYFLISSLDKAKVKIRKELSSEDAKIILAPMIMLDSKFKPYFKKNQPIIKAQIMIINQIWKEFGEKVVKNIEKFFNIKVPDEINVFVTLNPYGGGGGANFGNNGIGIELGATKRNPMNSFEVISHEIIHLAENKNNRSGSRELAKLGLNGKGEGNDANTANEAIIGLLIPNGFLSKQINLINNISPFGKPNSAYEEKRQKFMKRLADLVLDRLNNPKGNYVKDFLPKIVKRLS